MPVHGGKRLKRLSLEVAKVGPKALICVRTGLRICNFGVRLNDPARSSGSAIPAGPRKGFTAGRSWQRVHCPSFRVAKSSRSAPAAAFGLLISLQFLRGGIILRPRHSTET